MFPTVSAHGPYQTTAQPAFSGRFQRQLTLSPPDSVSLRFSGKTRSFPWPEVHEGMINYLKHPTEGPHTLDPKEFVARVEAIEANPPDGMSAGDAIYQELYGDPAEQQDVDTRFMLALAIRNGSDEQIMDWVRYFKDEPNRRTRYFAAGNLAEIKDPAKREAFAVEMAQTGDERFLEVAFKNLHQFSKPAAWQIIRAGLDHGYHHNFSSGTLKDILRRFEPDETLRDKLYRAYEDQRYAHVVMEYCQNAISETREDMKEFHVGVIPGFYKSISDPALQAQLLQKIENLADTHPELNEAIQEIREPGSVDNKFFSIGGPKETPEMNYTYAELADFEASLGLEPRPFVFDETRTTGNF